MIRLDYLTIVEVLGEDSQNFLENLLTIKVNVELTVHLCIRSIFVMQKGSFYLTDYF